MGETINSIKKISFIAASFPAILLLFSCQTRLEKEGWIRTPILSQIDSSVSNKKDKELYTVMYLHHPQNLYGFYYFVKDSSDRLQYKQFDFVLERPFKSDVSYYKWTSDSVCLVSLMKQGELQALIKITMSDSTQIMDLSSSPPPYFK